MCAICHLHCSLDQAVLDHCHVGGHIRAVLHRACNSLLGKIENGAPRYGMKFIQLMQFLHGVASYIDLHQANVTGLIHPTHFTTEEKVLRRKAKAKKIRTKAKALKKN